MQIPVQLSPSFVAALGLLLLPRSALSQVSPDVALAPPVTATEPAPAPRPAEVRPWRAHEALHIPWFRFGFEHRTRFEHLENDFRATNPGNATALSMRTLLSAELHFALFVFGAEAQDSRAWASDSTPLNGTIIDPVDVLQAYIGLRAEGLLAPDDRASLTIGRLTLDLGSRRLLARNEFRNTINAFTGVDLQWTSSLRDVLRAFAVMPVVRFPSERAALQANRMARDRENTDAVLSGVFFQSRPMLGRVFIEVYVLGLYERDSDLSLGANRRLITPGLRVLRSSAEGELDFQLELMGQLGKSRATAAATDTTDLDHRALSLHASSGYRFDVAWSPRVVLQYDYASGDFRPDDQVNHRFDPLFGARRFEFGPTGTYGAIARSNVSTPAVRVELQPHTRLDAFTAYRLVWLAAGRDAWTSTGLRDDTSASGSFGGQQAEARIRYHVLPQNLSFDIGGALFVPGELARRAEGGEDSPSLFVYSQITGTI